MNELRSVLSGSVDITSKEYEFPEIVIIGDEKNGKSSLMENITKCKIFPKDRAYCTKRPIRFILKHEVNKSYYVKLSPTETIKCNSEKHVCDVITKEFNKGELSHEEIVIECLAPENHNFTFVDLPGIKSFPEDVAEKTRSISDGYLANKNNIIILAYAATTSSDATCSTMNLLKKHNRQKDTILVMTMLDKLGDSGDIKYAHGQTFPDIENIFYVISDGKDENKWFSKYGIKGNVTATKLLSHTEKLFSEYVNKNWYKNIVANLEKQKVLLKSKKTELNSLTEQDGVIYSCLLAKLFANVVDSINIFVEFMNIHKPLCATTSTRTNAHMDFCRMKFELSNYTRNINDKYPDIEDTIEKLSTVITDKIVNEFVSKAECMLSYKACNVVYTNYNIYRCNQEPGSPCGILSSIGVDCGNSATRSAITKKFCNYRDALVEFTKVMREELKQNVTNILMGERIRALFLDAVKYHGSNCNWHDHNANLINNYKNSIGIDFTRKSLTNINSDILEKQSALQAEIDELDEKIKKLSNT